MLDHSFIPARQGVADIQIFRPGASNDWQVWRKPRGRSMASITVIGGGAGGGGGFTGATATARGGGGGGGSGAIARLIIPLLFLPDTLFLNGGNGGAGGAAGAAGSSGIRYWISYRATGFSLGDALLVSGNADATGGGAGSAAAGGTAGAASTVATTTAATSSLGVWVAIIGQAGAAGGTQTGAVGANVTFGASGALISGGAGGGGVGTANTDFAGGQVTGIGLYPTIAAGAAAAGAGGHGLFMQNPFGGLGGAGGGTAGASGTGGAGGSAGLGSGGGGGGGGVTGGAGGRGGDGIAVIVCW